LDVCRNCPPITATAGDSVGTSVGDTSDIGVAEDNEEDDDRVAAVAAVLFADDVFERISASTRFVLVTVVVGVNSDDVIVVATPGSNDDVFNGVVGLLLLPLLALRYFIMAVAATVSDSGSPGDAPAPAPAPASYCCVNALATAR